MDVVIEKYSLKNNKVKKNIKIALLTDIHIMDSTKESFKDETIESVKKIAPTYICLGGDYFCGYGQYNFNSPLSMELIKGLLDELKKIAPVILSLGNHDLSIAKEKELRSAFKKLKEENIYPLDNESIEFDDIYFSGFYPRRKSYAIAKISSKKAKMIIEDWNQANLVANKEKLSILCNHIPDIVLDKKIQSEAKALYNYDLILAGHAHNGWLSPKKEKRIEEKINKKLAKINGTNKEKIRRLKEKKYHGFCESIYSFPPFVRNISRGMHEINGTTLIVSRGITTTNGIKLAVNSQLRSDIFKGFSYVTEIDIKHKK
jgi:predicted MPP superfamily phosphohydrolase